uniref:SH2 domain-containing protein n=1 Tax=Gongylonema pulchrum TaxID=637853 RepID=A0A183D7B6_9BILA
LFQPQYKHVTDFQAVGDFREAPEDSLEEILHRRQYNRRVLLARAADGPSYIIIRHLIGLKNESRVVIPMKNNGESKEPLLGTQKFVTLRNLVNHGDQDNQQFILRPAS